MKISFKQFLIAFGAVFVSSAVLMQMWYITSKSKENNEKAILAFDQLNIAMNHFNNGLRAAPLKNINIHKSFHNIDQVISTNNNINSINSITTNKIEIDNKDLITESNIDIIKSSHSVSNIAKNSRSALLFTMDSLSECKYRCHCVTLIIYINAFMKVHTAVIVFAHCIHR